jgi:hypothetical protein
MRAALLFAVLAVSCAGTPQSPAGGNGGGGNGGSTGGEGGSAGQGGSTGGQGGTTGGQGGTTGGEGGATGGQGGTPGGAGGSAGGAGGSGGAPGGSGGSGGAILGDCASDADCPNGPCVEVTPGGFLVCVDPPAEATMCSGSGFDECCTTSDCAKGTCFPWPLTPYCGGPQPIDHNVCGADQCSTDAECGAGMICSLAGTLDTKVRLCVLAYCKTAADCTDEPGGYCAPVDGPCCGGSAGLFCVYPSDGCRNNGDCPGGYCSPDMDRASCQPGFPICPL